MFEINVIKNRLQILEKKISSILKVIQINKKKEILKKIKKTLFFADKKNQKNALIKKKTFLEKTIFSFEAIEKELKNIADLFDLAVEISDEDFYKETIREIDNIEKKLQKLEFFTMLSREHDISNCYVDIQSGSGGNEAQDWANMLLRMYLRWSEYKGFKTEIMAESRSEFGLKSSTIKIIGKYSYGWFRTETGIHRLVRKSPFDSGGRRHTSFSSVFVYPEIKHNIGIKIKNEDLRIDVYRASGAGGQHVNCTESAVRITHIPTNIVAQCQNNRSQHYNKEQALKQIKAKLYELEMQKNNIKKKELENSKSNIGWGNQIRSYILDHGRIKDLRTNVETHNIQLILDGHLDIFVEESLRLGL